MCNLINAYKHVYQNKYKNCGERVYPLSRLIRVYCNKYHRSPLTMTGPDSAVMCNLISTHTQKHTPTLTQRTLCLPWSAWKSSCSLALRLQAEIRPPTTTCRSRTTGLKDARRFVLLVGSEILMTSATSGGQPISIDDRPSQPTSKSTVQRGTMSEPGRSPGSGII